jgi:hypothetical protein
LSADQNPSDVLSRSLFAAGIAIAIFASIKESSRENFGADTGRITHGDGDR